METPDFSHIDPDLVYEPREDSFLLLDALERDLELIKNLRPTIACEIGPGSGIILAALSKVLGTSCFCLGIDVSAYACETTKVTFTRNRYGNSFDVLNMDLLCGLRFESKAKLDVLVFNPPYVCCEESEEIDPNNGLLDKTWNGGAKGTNTLDRLILDLDKLMAPSGLFYVVAISKNDIVRLSERISKRGFSAPTVVKERKIIGEHLHVLRFQRLEK